MTKTNKSQSKTDVLLDPNHSFDGIQEYDNDMPRWWVNLFIISVIFGAIYMAWYHLPFFPSESLEASFAKSMNEQEQLQKGPATSEQSRGQEDGAVEAEVTWSGLTQDAALVEAGKQTFNTNCVACHGPLGGGLVGPNLTDDYWIHDPLYKNLFRIVMEGVAEKGMPPWSPVIGPASAKAALAYIATLRGSNPANAKAPEGTPQALQ